MATGGPMTTPIDGPRLHLLLSLFSPAFPTGGFAWSHGLEVAVAAGAVHDAESTRAWIAGVLAHGAGRADAVLAAHAHAGAVEEADALARALAASAERAQETAEQGAAFARTAALVHGTDATPRALPAAVGGVAAALDLPLMPVLEAMLHAFAANLVSAAVRLVPLGQSEGQRVLAALFPLIGQVALEAARTPPGAIGTAAVLSDIQAIAHETAAPRLFRS